MKQDSKGRLIHEDYTSSFNYKGRLFIVDKFDDFWLATESQFLIKVKASSLKTLIVRTKKRWDEVDGKYNGCT